MHRFNRLNKKPTSLLYSIQYVCGLGGRDSSMYYEIEKGSSSSIVFQIKLKVLYYGKFMQKVTSLYVL
jgi:hypothetical protein